MIFRRWTDAEDEVLRTLAEKRASADEIAKALKTRSRSAVVSRSHKIDVKLNGRDIVPKPGRLKKLPAKEISRSATPKVVQRPKPIRAEVIPLSKNFRRIDALGPRKCRWPMLRDAEGEWLMCGENCVNEKRPYCAEHEADAHWPKKTRQ